MTFSSVGDMRQFFFSNQANFTTKTELNTLVKELTSGQKTDLTAHLGAHQTNLAGLDRQLEMLDRFAQTNTDTAQLLATMQTVLSGIDDQRATTSSSLLAVNASSSLSQIKGAGQIALSSFEATVNSLNTRNSDRSIFGGNDLDQNSLAAPDIMLDALRLEVAGISDPAQFRAAIEDWFDTPSGGFETLGYLGDSTGTMTRSVDADQTIDINVRADDPALRDTLKAFVLAALASEETTSLDASSKQALLKESALALVSNALPLTRLQSNLGYMEEQIENGVARIAAQETSYSIARNAHVAADPYETATRLQAVQQQLQTQYTLTARLSRLSLTEYLR